MASSEPTPEWESLHQDIEQIRKVLGNDIQYETGTPVYEFDYESAPENNIAYIQSAKCDSSSECEGISEVECRNGERSGYVSQDSEYELYELATASVISENATVEDETSRSAATSRTMHTSVQSGATSPTGTGAGTSLTFDIFSDISMPKTPETCLALNRVYQEIIQENINQVNTLLVENREKQRAIQAQLNDCSSYTPVGDGEKSKRNQKTIFAMPYFKDNKGMAPAPNEDVIMKRARQERSGASDLLHLNWIKSEDQQLLDAVLADGLRVHLQPILNRRDLLQEKLATLQHSKMKAKKANNNTPKITKNLESTSDESGKEKGNCMGEDSVEEQSSSQEQDNDLCSSGAEDFAVLENDLKKQ